MTVLLTCPQGHQWRPDESDREGATPPRVCPVCGATLPEPRGDIARTLEFVPPEGEAADTPRSSATPFPRSPVPGGPASHAATIAQESQETPSQGGTPILSQHIPGHEILGELGRGGMGVVYKARQLNLNRLVALKMILAGARADPQQLLRFRAEAEAVARLQHPNIVQIYEIGEYQGCPYFALEYVDGGSLADKLTGAPQPPRLAAHLVMQLAQAMHSAHQRGIIHRDLKPGNVLLAAVAEHVSGRDSFHAEAQAAARLYGIPKITDFGLAKHLGDNLAQTQTGAILGTPSYMAPEQAEGRTHAIGPATDVWALGAILYEMLTGKPPFDAESSLTTIRQVLSDDPVPLSQLHLKVPHDLETICLKCLEKEPARRYASAEALADDLRRFLENKPIEARPSGWWVRTVKWARRHPTATALLIVVNLAAVLLLGSGLVYHLRLRRAVEETRREAEESHRNLIRLHVSQGTSAMNAGDGLTALLWFTEALRLEESGTGIPARAGSAAPEASSHEHEELHRQRIAAVLHTLPRLSQVWVHDGAVFEAHFSPDGKRVLTAGDDGTAHLWDSETGAAVGALLRHAGPIVHAVFSRDGRLVATASRDGTARVWDAETGKPITPPLEHHGRLRWVDISPDGRQAATVGPDRSARLWAIPAGTPLAELKHAAQVRQAVFSPDGQRLLTAADDGTAHLWDVRTHQEAPFELTHEGAVLHAVFSPDGKRVATASADHTARIWDALTGAPVSPPLRHRDAVSRVAFSPYGRRLLTASDDGTARLWRSSDGAQTIEPLRHSSPVRAIAFSPDGCRVATAGDDNLVRVWNATTGAPLTPPLRYHGTVNHAVFNPDGRRLLAASDDGTARIWEVSCRRLSVVLHETTAFRRQAERNLPGGTSGAGVPPASAPQAGGTPAPPAPPVASPDGKKIIKITDDNTARVCDAATGQPIGPPLAHRNAITHAGFSPDGKRVVTTSEDGTAQVWDADSGERIGPLLHHPSAILYAAFSPDGGRVVTTSDDNTGRVWDVESGALLLPPLKHNGTVTCAAFGPDGRRVATASLDRTARVWDASTGQVLTPPLEHPWPIRRLHFEAEGRRLVTSGPDGASWAWDLPCSTCLTGDLVQLAQLLSGSRIDERRGLMPLEPHDLKAAWDAWHAAHGDLLTFCSEDVLTWHRQAAEECASGRHWEAAIWHLDHLIRADPDDWVSFARRGLARAELGRWDGASSDFATVVKRAPERAAPWCFHALLRLRAGDRDGYRRACAALMEQQAKHKDDPRTAYLAVWTCTLAPGAGVGPARLIDLAEEAVARNPDDPEQLCTLGAALYRAGRAESAARRLNEALALRGRKGGTREWLLLALARHRLGLTVEARQWLNKATAVLAAPADAESALPWAQRIHLDLLRQEAEHVLKGERGASAP